jgi:hypothetical protein
MLHPIFARCHDAPSIGLPPDLPRLTPGLSRKGTSMHELDHDIRVWLTAEQYAGLVRLAHADERPISAFVRRLIARALEESVEHDPQAAMASAGLSRDAWGRD